MSRSCCCPLLVSRDVYSYIAHGQIVSLHHANPYVQTPADFPGFLSRTLVGPQWVDTPSVYGPLFTHLAGRRHPDLDAPRRARRRVPAHRDRGEPRHDVRDRRRVAPRPPGRAAFAVAAFGLNPVILFQSAGERAQRPPRGARRSRSPPGACSASGRTGRSRSSTCGALVKATAFLPLRAPRRLGRLAAAARSERLRAGATHAAVAPGDRRVVACPFLQLHDPTLGMLELSSHEGWLAPSRFFRRVLDAISGDTLGVVARVVFALALVAAVVVARPGDRACGRVGATRARAPRRLGVGAARPDAARPGAPAVVPRVVAPADLDPSARAPRLVDRAVGRARAVAVDGGAAPVPGRVRPEHPDRALRRSRLIVIGLLVWLALDLRRRSSIPLPLHDEEGASPPRPARAEAASATGGSARRRPSRSRASAARVSAAAPNAGAVAIAATRSSKRHDGVAEAEHGEDHEDRDRGGRDLAGDDGPKARRPRPALNSAVGRRRDASSPGSGSTSRGWVAASGPRENGASAKTRVDLVTGDVRERQLGQGVVLRVSPVGGLAVEEVGDRADEHVNIVRAVRERRSADDVRGARSEERRGGVVVVHEEHDRGALRRVRTRGDRRALREPCFLRRDERRLAAPREEGSDDHPAREDDDHHTSEPRPRASFRRTHTRPSAAPIGTANPNVTRRSGGNHPVT